MSISLSPTTASIVESIKFTRYPGTCEHGKQHDRYEICWTHLRGCRVTRLVYWCPHPLCDTDSRWRLSTSPPDVKLTAWIPGMPAVAVAYLLLTFDPEGRFLPRMESRIGICSQWKDPSVGNFEEPGEPRRLFTERYFAESGPGIYAATITEAS